MLVALKPIHDKFKIERIDITTLQAVSGTGKEATEELLDQLSSYAGKKNIESNIYPKQIAIMPFHNAMYLRKTGIRKKKINFSKKRIKYLIQIYMLLLHV